MKFTIITACRNAATTLPGALASVFRQELPEDVALEHIVMDGASTDETATVLRDWASRLAFVSQRGFDFRYTSESDQGLYDAINKGLDLATGDIIGILNADDVFATDDVIARLAEAFRADPTLDLTYGDIRFVRAGGTVEEVRAAPVVRYCTGRWFRPWMFRFATFPAHPSTFVRAAAYRAAGPYSLAYPVCADFEMMLRLIRIHGVRTRYLPFCTTVMRLGGLSTSGFSSMAEINREDVRALRANGIWSALPLVYLKYLLKIWGYIFRGGL